MALQTDPFGDRVAAALGIENSPIDWSRPRLPRPSRAALLAAVVAILALGLVLAPRSPARALLDRDTVPECAKAIGVEWALNLSDPDRPVRDDVDYIPQCDSLTPAQQEQASTAVVDEVYGGWLGTDG